MFDRERVALYMASRSLARGSRTSLVLNVTIIALVFTNMILLPSIISGSVELFNQQSIDFQTSDIQVRPAEGDQYIGRAGALLETVNRVPGVRRASARHGLGGTLSARNRSVSVPVTAIDPRNEVEVTKIHEQMKDGEFFSGGGAGGDPYRPVRCRGRGHPEGSLRVPRRGRGRRADRGRVRERGDARVRGQGGVRDPVLPGRLLGPDYLGRARVGHGDGG